MTFAFDLISDLHTDTWPEFDWSGQATSPVCVVAGDVAIDRQLLKKTLTHLGQNYQAVFYIDGNDEHRNTFEQLGDSYKDLVDTVSNIKNVVYMHDQVVIINGVAILATNGWWSFDWNRKFSVEHCMTSLQQYYNISETATQTMLAHSINDSDYIERSLERLQTHQDVKKIVIITHTVPQGQFIEHDSYLTNSYRINTGVNSHIASGLSIDTEEKTKVWCFGHFHQSVDQVVDGIRYVCNPRGRTTTPWHRDPYFPVRIEI